MGRVTPSARVYSLPAVSWALFDLASTTFSMNVMGRLIWQHRQLRWFMLAMLLYLDVHDTATIYMSAYANFAMGGVWVLSRSLLTELGWPEHRTKLFTIFGLIGRATTWIVRHAMRLRP